MPAHDDLIQQALAEHRAGRLDAAEQLYGRILAAEPANFTAMHMLGVIALQSGRAADAERLIARARALDGQDKLACINHGNALQELGRFEEAISSYDAAIEMDPTLAGAFSNRGNALRNLGRLDEALRSFDRAVELNPSYARAWSNRGLALLDDGRPAEALSSFDRALATDPLFADAEANRALALHQLGRFEEGLAACDRALALRPVYPEALSNRGSCLKELEQYDQALESFTEALRLKPEFADARYNRGLTRLLLGDFAAGWRDYEYRPTGPYRRLGIPPFEAPVWSGESLAGKRVIVLSEQGLGDTIQFARYLPLLRSIAAGIFFYTRPSLLHLFEGFDGVRVGSEIPDEIFDVAIPLLSLPLAFATAETTIPSDVPYLRPEPQRVQRWRARIGETGFRVGVCWQGNAASPADRGRSFAASLLLPLAENPGVRLISLQQQNGLEQLASLPEGLRIQTLDEAERDGYAFADTAAIMQSLDLVVTCDTAIAHVAGATARPVWVALKRVHHWVWLLDRRETLWYPTMRLFRQPRHGDWQSVLGEMSDELRDLLRQR